jgi:hypothetical protein
MARAARFVLGALALALAAVIGPPARAQDAPPRPLLMEGKTTIFQRVLTRPGASLYAEADGPAAEALAAFQPYYVFRREGDWIEAGPSIGGGPAGWLMASEVVEWKQNIVAAFNNPSQRERTLFFDSREALERVLRHESAVELAARLRAAAAGGASAPDSGVLSIEPAEYVDIRRQLYLLPILDFVEDFHPMTFDPFLELRVASVPLREDPPAASDLADFDAGVVFVIDTTLSMEPYIEETKEAVEEIIGGIRDSDVGARVHFGLWGFRDNVDAVPEIEYRTREYLPLARRDDPSAIVEALAAMRATKVNNPNYHEDSLAGVEDAIEKSDWAPEGREFGGKYVVLVTDASPNPPRDPNSRSEIDAAGVQAKAENRGVAVMTLHLKAPSGAANHAPAEAAYGTLSRFGGGTYYFAVEGADRDAFGAQVRRLVEAFGAHVRTAMGADGDDGIDPALAELGRAMQLAYLGREAGTQAPPVVESWVADVALEDGRKLALEPRLLVTRNELSTLSSVIDSVLAASEQAGAGQGDQRQFFRQIKDALALMAQNPDVLVNTEFDTLGGAFGEILESLPYASASELLQITEERWLNSGTLQQEITDRLRARRTLYEGWHDDPANWTALHEGAPDGEHVFAMPLSVLP